MDSEKYHLGRNSLILIHDNDDSFSIRFYRAFVSKLKSMSWLL
jgi:hypothetical protein